MEGREGNRTPLLIKHNTLPRSGAAQTVSTCHTTENIPAAAAAALILAPAVPPAHAGPWFLHDAGRGCLLQAEEQGGRLGARSRAGSTM